nr:hypothetical protein [Tanacetum cinerariifolium]
MSPENLSWDLTGTKKQIWVSVVFLLYSFIDEEDPIPHDLADSDDEDLVNLDIDDGVNISTHVVGGHSGDDGGDDVPLYTRYPLVDCRPRLTCIPTWNLIAGQKSMRSSSSICKRSTMARRLLSRKGIGFLKRTGVTTWSASDADVPRTFPRSAEAIVIASALLTGFAIYKRTCAYTKRHPDTEPKMEMVSFFPFFMLHCSDVVK